MNQANICIVASAQYPIDLLKDWQHFANKINRWVQEATDHNAQLLVFPEYASMELASLFPPGIRSDLSRQIEAMQELLPDYISLFATLSERHGVYILSGTYPVDTGCGMFRNRSMLFAPDGTNDHQDKLQMTRFENECWGIRPGNELRVFDTRLGKIGVCICYDSEFPMFARLQVEAGADIILVPSCTDRLAGYNRVRIGCQARALENQCFVVQSSTVGEADWSGAVDVNVGAAAIYTPVDHGFPESGILQQGELNETQWIYAELDSSQLHTIRKQGQVLNHRDWDAQFLKSLASIRTIRL